MELVYLQAGLLQNNGGNTVNQENDKHSLFVSTKLVAVKNLILLSSFYVLFTLFQNLNLDQNDSSKTKYSK